MKTDNLTILLVLLCSCLQSLNSYAQNRVRTYQTQAVHQRLLAKNPSFKAKLRTVERKIANYRMVGLQEEITIPVIFHIVYTEPIEQISAEQIYSQIAALNRDFGHEVSKVNSLLAMDTLANFYKARPNDVGIRFCLGKMQGRAGINYVSSAETNFGADDAIKSIRDAKAFAANNYLNIWVGALADSVSGYAQMPGGNPTTDGIVIDYRFFGTSGTATPPYNNGNTLTHLVGSYLGLYELWNELEPCGDDGVWDTPIHNAPNYGRIEHYRHVSLCDGNPTEMTVNFMDATIGGYMFTKGQRKRMNAVLSTGGVRAGLNKGKSLCADDALVEFPQAENRNSISKINTVKEGLSFTLYPNPVKNELNVTIHETNANVIIYSLSGKLLHQAESVQQLQLNVSNWTQGLYYVQIWKDDQRLTKPFVVAQ